MIFIFALYRQDLPRSTTFWMIPPPLPPEITSPLYQPIFLFLSLGLTFIITRNENIDAVGFEKRGDAKNI